MKTVILTVFCLFLNTSAIFSQNKYFSQTYRWTDWHSGRKVLLTPEGDIVSIGGFRSVTANYWTTYFLKTNQYGDSTASNLFSGLAQYGVCSDLLPTESGYAITGLTHQYPYSDLDYRGFLLQADTEGIMVDFKLTGLDTSASSILDMERTADGGYLLAGYKIVAEASPYWWELYLVRLDAEGNTLWERVYDQYPYYNTFSSIAPANDGGYMLYGTTNIKYFVNPVEAAIILMKVDQDGIMEWDSIYRLHPVTNATGQLRRISDGNYIAIAGIDTDAKHQVIFKVSPTGQILWQVQYLNYDCGISEVVELPNGELVFTNCYYLPGASRTDMAIFKLSPNGNLRWWRRFGNPGFHDYGYDIKRTSDGGFVVAGRQDTLGGSATWIVRTNCMGLVTPEPKAAFSWQADAINPFALRFENHSQYAYADSIDGGKYIWDWGDGTPLTTFATEAFPEVYHYYATPGTFTVTLRAIVCQDTSMVQALVSTTSGAGGTVGVSEILASDYPALKVYPNPAKDGVTITFPPLENGGQFEWALYHYTGKQVHTLTAQSAQTYLLDTQTFAQGLYYYRVYLKGEAYTQGKLIIVK